MNAATAPPLSTPCTKVCVIDPRTALCAGCGRTVSEIAAWGGLDEPARLAIMAQLQARLASLPPVEAPPAPREA
jgi:uncharacterized protein